MFKSVVFVAALVASASAFAPATRTFVPRSVAVQAQFEESGDYEVAIKKLETEAEERMAEKIAEMEKSLETTGQAN
eukprot:CAMPEP_0198292080 /NCGR_PEP_ID=MMETSP1449-20131203/9842_1 /TAXON_ID=420275 /ORGANISM="Attheya septentrionalis, Strain CCMP2084" /LENGTH=75 /DNA_ID=CAMNT_0043990791 /DNA_START=26 /DNA_END=253 /DNA_ORIENTATION=+